MLRPFLMIGVGGSGGKTLRVVRDELCRLMERSGWTGPLPRAWQFLHIDVPTHADGNDPDLPAQLPPGDYRGLVRVGLTYRNIDAALAGTGRTTVGDAMGTWRPDPGRVNIPASKGAGQYRTLGRVITIAGLEDIRDSLWEARRRITGTEVVAELQAVTRALGGVPTSTAPDPVVLVVASIAGGSGSGAIIDVCDAVRGLGDPWASESIAFLYAPDVFDYLKEEYRRGVRPNSLAALGEILSGYWNSEGPSEETADLLARNGIQLGPVNRLGPRYPFLIGNRNEHVSYATQNDVYRAMGRSVASWVSSSVLQDRIGAYTQGNWSSAAQTVTDALPIHSAGTETPFTALGSARVGLGRDRFREYAGEVLARESVERVLRRHEELRAPDDERIERALVAEVAQDAFGSFLAVSGLAQRGETDGDILSALRPVEQVPLAKRLAEEVRARVAGGIGPKGLPAAEVRHRVVSECGARAPGLLDELRAARHLRARDWVAAIQARLRTEAARCVAVNGAPVAEATLRLLEEELRSVRAELADQAAAYERWAGSGDQEVAEQIDAGGATITAASPAILGGIHRAVDALVHRDEAELRQLATALIGDLAANLVEPLREAVARGRSALAAEEVARPEGQSAPLSTWPADDVVPGRLAAAPNEFLLEPTANYPEVLSSLVTRSVEASEPGAARRDAVTQVTLGTDEPDLAGQELITCQVEWVPRDHNLRPGQAPSRATFTLATRAVDLLGRARRWLEREGTPVGRYVHQNLRDYLEPRRVDPGEHARRLAAFEGGLVAALDAAAPLVSVNPGVLVQVHGVAAARGSMSFSEIPFPDRSPAQEVVRRVLQSKDLWNEETASCFGEGTQSAIDVFSVLSEPYQPVVFDSLMKPIAAEWGSRSKTADSRAEFWRWRRARALPEALPLSPAMRRAMIRGWFTAKLIRQLHLDERGVRIWVPNEAGPGGSYREFPKPLLTTDSIAEPELLPAVLESVLLAMVEVSTSASLEPMAPYRRLRDLGRSGRGGGYEAYVEPAAELRAWIESGGAPGGEPGPPVGPAADADGGSLQERRKSAEHRFERLHQNYTRYFGEVEERADVLDVPASFDLRFDVLAALTDLRRAVSHVADPTDERDLW